MDIVIYYIYKITTKYEVTSIIIALSLFFYLLIKRKPLNTGIVFLMLSILNFFFGFRLTNYLVYTFGEDGSAIVNYIRDTDDLYKHQPVMEYIILINIGNREDEIYGRFKNNNSKIYPLKKKYRYPQRGERFDVKFIKKRPEIFVVVNP